MKAKTATTATAPKAAAGKKVERRAPNVSMPEGVSMQPLTSGLRPEGFLIIPTDDHPTPTMFRGILRGVSEKPDPKHAGKVNAWGIFEALGDQKGHVYDKETGETTPVTGGMLIGISRKGALHGMRQDKVGHLFALEFTGKKIKMGAGKNPMWEILAAVSTEPYESADE